MTAPPLVGLALVLGAAGFATAGCRLPGEDDPTAAASTEPAADQATDVEMVPVIRQDVVEQEKAEARVGNGTAVTLPLQVEGIVTWAPEEGERLGSGDVIIEVAGRPVVLVVGESPLYRPLRLVATGERDEAGTRLGRQTGADVDQLQRFLLDEGYDDGGRLSADGEFGRSTQRAVKDWQRAVGHPATGVVDTSQVVFMTTELLVVNHQVVGQTFERLDVTGTDTVLQIVGSTTLREYFEPGSTVEVLADPPTTGVVTRSTRVGGEVGVEQLIEITVDGVSSSDLGQSVQVVGSVTRAADALTVPVRALLAVTGGGWEVEVDSVSGSTRVAVELIDVVDSTAVISGLKEGDQVEVPL